MSCNYPSVFHGFYSHLAVLNCPLFDTDVVKWLKSLTNHDYNPFYQSAIRMILITVLQMRKKRENTWKVISRLSKKRKNQMNQMMKEAIIK